MGLRNTIPIVRQFEDLDETVGENVYVWQALQSHNVRHPKRNVFMVSKFQVLTSLVATANHIVDR